ncbi:MAG: pantetheine-phosphate adenylyltransferase [Caldilineaceae bacterium]|nr:pantetheine-phosphate adenylyltransferase [Caldilineaceae bacterium]
MTRALYPGSFDPIHNGHIDIATRASAIFDELIVAIYDAPPKKNVLFSTDERLEMARRSFIHLPNVQVTTYVGLTVDCARDEDAQVIIRGLRNVADFEYEHQIGWANHQMASEIELCCLFCDGNFAYLSATILKEVASLGGDISQWAPPHVQSALAVRFAENQQLSPSKATKGRSSKLAHHA